MEKKNFAERWLDAAVSGIRFGPDRKAVAEELRGHLEDKTADLQRFYHISKEEAEKMALERMGDAEEIGKELAKIHKPWLGYLWRGSQWALGLSVLLWLLSSGWDMGSHIPPLVPGEETEQVTFVTEDELELGQYRFRVEEAYWEGHELTVVWKVTNPAFWEPIGHVPSYFWQAEDNLGNKYCRYADHHDGTSDRPHVSSDITEKAGFGWRVEQTVPEVPQEVQWLRLTYDGPGERGSVLLEREVSE